MGRLRNWKEQQKKTEIFFLEKFYVSSALSFVAWFFFHCVCAIAVRFLKENENHFEICSQAAPSHNIISFIKIQLVSSLNMKT